MPIQTECDCGKTYRVKDELAGKRFRCTECGTTVRIPQPEEEPLEVSLAEEPPRRRVRVRDEEDTPRPARRDLASRRVREEEEEDRPVRRRPSRREEDDDTDPDTSIKKKKKKRRATASAGGSSGGGFTTTLGPIVGGLLMMIGGAVWFFAGLAANRIFFYAPVLCVLGLVSLIKGLTGEA